MTGVQTCALPIYPGLMSQKPRVFSSSFFSVRELIMSMVQGGVITAVLLSVLYMDMHSKAGESTARTHVFLTLIFANVLLTLTGRSTSRSLLTTLRYKNWMVPMVIGATIGMTTLIIFWPPLQTVFGMVHMGWQAISICFVLAACSVLWIEFGKRR